MNKFVNDCILVGCSERSGANILVKLREVTGSSESHAHQLLRHSYSPKSNVNRYRLVRAVRQQCTVLVVEVSLDRRVELE